MKGFEHTDPKDYIALCNILGHTNLWGELPQIDKPVLVVTGSADEVTTVEEANKMGKAIPNAEVAILEASHLANFEDPRFNEFLFSHFKKDA